MMRNEVQIPEGAVPLLSSGMNRREIPEPRIPTVSHVEETVPDGVFRKSCDVRDESTLHRSCRRTLRTQRHPGKSQYLMAIAYLTRLFSHRAFSSLIQQPSLW